MYTKSFLVSVCMMILNYSFSQITPKPGFRPNDGTKQLYKNTIDPAVTDIKFTTIKKTTGDKLRITGVIKNIGGKNYVSGANQQFIQLWENRSGVDRRKLKDQAFTNLNAGQEIQISIEIPAIKPGKEFPPDYQVILVYDPDIYIDANKSNDDAVSSNNSLTKNPRP